MFRCKSDEFNLKTIETVNKERHKQNLFKKYNLDAYKSRFGKQKKTVAYGDYNSTITASMVKPEYTKSLLTSPKQFQNKKLSKQSMVKKGKHQRTTIDLRSLSSQKSGSKLAKENSKKSFNF